ncbi:hypothetical protein G6F60_015051 [Rhizopus arrhizus]|nr:hypothetical protein G6F60_015051 [Rhizopus arrhizus]
MARVPASTTRTRAGTARVPTIGMAMATAPMRSMVHRTVPIMPLAPGRFSTIKGWPRRRWSCSAITRARISLPPPGAKPTIIRTGRAGYSCAAA